MYSLSCLVDCLFSEDIPIVLMHLTSSPHVHITIDNRPTEKGLETRNFFFAISHSGARCGHMIYKWR